MRFHVAGIMLLAACLGAESLEAQQRVKPRPFDQREADRVFFPDVFSVLVGPRPAVGAAPAGSPAAVAAADSAGPAADVPAGEGWSRWISAATLENEIKAVKVEVDREVTTVSQFRGRGHLECRRLFSVSATVFAVIAEYDQQVRWREDAAGIRDVFARTAFNCKTGDKRVYDQAKLRKGDLQELISGQVPPVEAGEALDDWAKVTDRGPLMQRLEIAFNQRLKSLARSDSEFAANAEDVKHEAEVIAMLSEVLTRGELEDSGDDTYTGYARQMRDAAREVALAVKNKDFAAAGPAIGNIAKACSDCHDGYR